jgi:hypothetical protein
MSASIWKRRCQRLEKHLADHVPPQYWPELSGQAETHVGLDVSAAPDRIAAARAALEALTGPERVEVIRHYMGSAKKALRSLSGQVSDV